LEERLLAIQRRPEGLKVARPGYPGLFLAQGVATKILTEIFANQPVVLEDLPEAQGRRLQAVKDTAKRLEGQRLVIRRLSDRFAVAYDTNQEHPLFFHVAKILSALAAENGLSVVRRKGRPRAKVRTPASVLQKKFMGQDPHPIYTLFGSRRRTSAVLTIAAMGELDQTTIGKIVQSARDSTIIRLLDPIEGDGLIVSSVIGLFTTYKLAEAPWAGPLRDLALAVIELDPLFKSRLAAGKVILANGPGRAPLRRHLGIPDPP
jgi:hypothetical protein